MNDLFLTDRPSVGAWERGSVGASSHSLRSTLPTLLTLLTLFLSCASCKKSEGDAKPADVDYYTCTMHPSVKKQSPKDKCPICSMDLEPVKKKGATPAAGDVDYYTCTMHPSVKSKDPKAKCPICSMDLTPVKKKGAGTAGPADEHAAHTHGAQMEKMPGMPM